ncbi:MAG: class I SAM-dependent methyltransferase [Pelagibaca sp.]
MAVKLGHDRYTKPDQADHRLRRIMQVAVDAVGKPLEQCRVLDLACLEGHYAIEFALHGASAVGIELREANIEKAAFAAKSLKLENVKFYMDDVNNLSAERYGMFDIIICSGILYHLTSKDACALIERMRSCCRGIVLLDTLISTKADETVDLDGRRISGSRYVEHDARATKEEKLADVWASVEHSESFWLSEVSLYNVMRESGFSSCTEIMVPFHPGHSFDRRTYLAFCGTRVKILSSDATDMEKAPDVTERHSSNIHPSQVRRSMFFKIAKRIAPQKMKDAVKPSLRRMGLLNTSAIPEHLEHKKAGPKAK